MALRYAVHAYSWTGSWSNKSLWIIDHVKDLGFDVIEVPLMEIDLVDPEAIRERLESASLGVCCSVVLSRETDITSPNPSVRVAGVRFLKRCLDAADRMGSDVLTGVIYSALGYLPEEEPSPARWDRAASALKQVARYAEDLGITIGLEPVNRYETFLINTCDQAMEMMQRIRMENVAIHLDAYHMNIEENDFYNPTLKAAPYLCHYHLSESHRGIPGTGTVDWRAIYRGLADGGYRGLVGLESFVEVSDSMRRATCVWRKLAPDSDTLVTRGLQFLKRLERETFS